MKSGEFLLSREIAFSESRLDDLQVGKYKMVLELGILSLGEIFGEEEFFGCATREYSVKSLSADCLVMRITKEDLEYIIQDRVTMKKFTDLIGQKRAWRQARVAELVDSMKMEYSGKPSAELRRFHNYLQGQDERRDGRDEAPDGNSSERRTPEKEESAVHGNIAGAISQFYANISKLNPYQLKVIAPASVKMDERMISYLKKYKKMNAT